jgi:hypothetical protein
MNLSTIKRQLFSLTCDAGGNASVTGRAIIGKLVAISYRPGTIATGATLTVTCEDGVYSKPLLTLANAGTSNLTQYPRDLMNAVADGSALTGTAGGDRTQPIMNGAPKVVIASGGSGGVGSVIVYYEA